MWMAFILLLMPGLAWATPISVDIDRNVNLALGTKNFGPVSVPDDVSVCTFTVDRSEWTNPAATMSANLSMSVNNGPFVFWLGMTSQGSAVDAQVPNTVMRRELPAGINRRVQGNYVVSGARFRSTITVACQ